MSYLICPKCNEMNAASAVYCSSCGESLRGAQVMDPSDKAYAASVESKLNKIEKHEARKEAYVMVVVGLIFALLPAAFLVSAKDRLELGGLLLCASPILLGLMLLVGGIAWVIYPEKFNPNKASAEAGSVQAAQAGSAPAQVRCAVCNRTNADYLRDLKRKDPNVYIISTRFLGTCPICKKAYCVEHSAYDGDIDHEVCPVHKAKLIVA